MYIDIESKIHGVSLQWILSTIWDSDIDIFEKYLNLVHFAILSDEATLLSHLVNKGMWIHEAVEIVLPPEEDTLADKNHGSLFILKVIAITKSFNCFKYVLEESKLWTSASEVNYALVEILNEGLSLELVDCETSHKAPNLWHKTETKIPLIDFFLHSSLVVNVFRGMTYEEKVWFLNILFEIIDVKME